MPETYAAVPRALIEDAGVGSRAKTVYAALTKFANRERLAWPFQATVAKAAGCSVPTVERAVRELKASGWITIEKRFAAGPNTYRLNLQAEPDEPDEEQVAEPDEDDCREQLDETGAQDEAGHPNDGVSVRRSPIKSEGSLPSKVRALSDTYLENEEHLPPRGAVRAAGRVEGLDDGFDPMAACGLFDTAAPAPAVKEPGARALAFELRDAWARSGPGALPGDINVAAVSGQIAAMRRGGVTAVELRAMIALFVEARGFLVEGALPWRCFLSRRHALLLKVRTAADAKAAENDPGYWKPEQRDWREESATWYAEQFGQVPA